MSKNKSRKRKQRELKRGGAAQAGQESIDKFSAVKSTGQEKAKSGSFISFHGFRELVESVVIAFILAFLFRTFEAEAFVIPTGSMANTLMGRHKDLQCDKCGYQFQVSASEEVDSHSGQRKHVVVTGGICPMCRHTMQLSPGSLRKKDNRSFNGDRIIVGKFMYQFEDPQRWDVSVFKFPSDSKINYIKRLVGLPNETVKINRGNLFVKPDGADEFSIARKPPDKMRAMLQPVYDNDYVLPGMIEKGWPARWQDDNGPDGWKPSGDQREFTVSGKAGGTKWLQYRHFVPTSLDWIELRKGPLPQYYKKKIKPQLVTDFNAYNSRITKGERKRSGIQGYGLHWVGDLAVECDLQVDSTSGKAFFKLVEGGRDMLCTIDLASGKATLTIPGSNDERTGSTPISKPGTYKVLFSNVDDQLRLWVDDNLIAFDKPTTYGELDNRQPQGKDLAPVGIGSQDAKLRVSHLKVLRDIYYIADITGNDAVVSDYDLSGQYFDAPAPQNLSPQYLAGFFSDPNRWGVFDSDAMRSVEFPLAEDQFLMFGDNSAMSKDSRLWDRNEYFVDRDLLIGKALYIYWPHSWDKVPGTDIPFPFFPNVKEMNFVR